MIEVEVKAKIESFEEIKKELEKISAIKTKTEYQKDIYFNSPIVDFAQSDEALRIRKTMSNDNTNIFITYKGPKIDKNSKTRKEIEKTKTKAQNQIKFRFRIRSRIRK